MRCARCDKRIREVYYVNGNPYGIECAKIRGYIDKKVVIKKSTDNGYQLELFNQPSSFDEWRDGLEW